jgi:hypothetical protein
MIGGSEVSPWAMTGCVLLLFVFLPVALLCVCGGLLLPLLGQ